MKSVKWTVLFLAMAANANAKKILYFGDSQSYGAMGSYIAQDLEKGASLCSSNPQQENDVTLYAVSGSSPRHWGDRKFSDAKAGWLCTRKMKQYQTGQNTVYSSKNRLCDSAKRKKISPLEEAISQAQPDMVVFQFLGNTAWYYNEAMKLGGEKGEQYLRKYVFEYLRSVIGPVGNRECLFITSNPAHTSFQSRNISRQGLQQKFVEYIAELNPNCRVIQGNNDETINGISQSRDNYQSDRLHLSDQGGRLFADYVKKVRCEDLSEALESSILECPMN